MTDEFKSTLFSYLTGKLKLENKNDEEIFKTINDIPFEKWENYLPTEFKQFNYEGLLQDKTSDYLILYGGYYIDHGDEARGIITILNQNFEPVKSIYQFSNGTNLRYIQCIGQSEDGEYFAIDSPEYMPFSSYPDRNNDRRFLMLNNFTKKINGDFILNLKKSYYFPEGYLGFYCKKIYKNPAASQYVMIGHYHIQSINYRNTIRVIELKINVGSENEWSKIDDDKKGYMMGDSYVDFQEEKYFLEILLSKIDDLSNSIYLWQKDFEDNDFSIKRGIMTFPYKPYIDTAYFRNQCCFINKNEFYFIQNNVRYVDDNKMIGLYYYNNSTNETKTIYEKEITDIKLDNELIFIDKNNNEIYIQFNDNINPSSMKADYSFQRLIDYKWNPQKVGTNKSYGDRAIYVSNVYNNVSIYSYGYDGESNYWQFYQIKENFNRNKYNGSSYINDNSLISDNSEIYSNNSLVFARNLYNKTINNNITVSTVEIPNTYLNGIELTSKNLLSETNLTMVEDTNVTQKNIYETMFLNFINVLQVADRNNATQVLNQEASTYLNNAINTDNSYDSAKLYNKVIINYQDGSSKESSYSLENTTETSTVIAFGLYIDKLINNVEIVSNDKTITYQTIDLSSLELNKYYAIRQKMEVV